MPRNPQLDSILNAIDRVDTRLRESLPAADDLHNTTRAVREATQLAGVRVRGMNKPFSIPRIRLYLTLLAIGLVVAWVYLEYLDRRQVRLALTRSDSSVLRERTQRNRATGLKLVDCEGSTDGLRLIGAHQAEATIVQGGVSIPAEFERMGTIRREHVLFFRPATFSLGAKTKEKIITFRRGQGSHLLGRKFFASWGAEVEWLFAWDSICAATPTVAHQTVAHQTLAQADGVFVVIDPADPAARRGLRLLQKSGYRLADANLGAVEVTMPFLRWQTVRHGYYLQAPPALPLADHATYTVANDLVVRSGLTARQRQQLQGAFDLAESDLDFGFAVLHSSGQSITADLANLFEGLVNFALIMAALLGLEILLHRRYIQELNGIISSLSILQSERDLFEGSDPDQRRENARYLGGCADLLGLVSATAGYYAQSNAALAFNGMAAAVHSRANLLKLNIQMKLLHGGGAEAGPDS